MSFKIKKQEDNSSEILKELKKLDKMRLRWGANTERSAEIFLYNEFGTSRTIKDSKGKETKVEHIPERPAMRNTFNNTEVQDKIAKRASFVIEQITKGKKALDAARGIGETGLAELKKTFTSDVPPPNAPSTIAKKGPGKNTLRDSGELFDDLGYEVVGG